ncbi:unnamed protein product [Larinioides sclopetarius]|uniref:Uncharacterized protein n=1 Tax=Larinioides sclopetarius TaxID=280406 RepID=A0AAV2AA80_9ARAC
MSPNPAVEDCTGTFFAFSFIPQDTAKSHLLNTRFVNQDGPFQHGWQEFILNNQLQFLSQVLASYLYTLRVPQNTFSIQSSYISRRQYYDIRKLEWFQNNFGNIQKNSPVPCSNIWVEF